MIRVSFTKFLDFVAQTGEPKATTALQAWRQSNTPYDPRQDYHKRIRNLIVDSEKSGSSPNWDEFIANQNPKKQKNFRETADLYQKWRDKHSEVSWFTPPRGDWQSSEFQITVNPELGLVIDGKKHVIKLFLNKNKLSRLKAQMAGLLMHETLATNSLGTEFSVFDVKAEKLHTFTEASEKLSYLLVGETAHLSAMLEAIRGTK
ncbi:hypothetical protein [Aquicoccus porphyridii]|uniref:hypothetical protein n=1 Tax=Aquicoccus porphyridii TaxID=1852029 RepID=UPI00273F1A35|nr:hypothetical protein [Aquicoccus porphyridii]